MTQRSRMYVTAVTLRVKLCQNTYL